MQNIDIYNKGIEKTLENNKLEGLNNNTILVVGANGLIGSAIIDVLNYLNDKYNYSINIIGTVRNKNKILDRFNKYKNLKIVEYDVSNRLELDDKVDYIINTASNAHPQKFSTDPVGTIVTNFIGTKNLLDYAKDNNCKRLLYISSGEVYGQPKDNVESFNEDYIGEINSVDPRSCYPLGKLSAENLCVSYSKQYLVNTVIARPCHTYGPTQTPNDSRVTTQFINNVLEDKDIIMKSRGEQIRSYTYVLDSVTGLLTILLYGKIGEVYNVSNNNSVVSIKEMADIIASTCNKKVVFELPSSIEKEGYNKVTRSVLDGTKLEKIGWVPVYTFNEGINETIKVLKKTNK